jgi:hypothetical protein
MDVKNLAENAPTTIMTCAIGLTGHAPPALVDSADQDAIYVCKINIPFKNNQLLSLISAPSIIFAKAPDVTDVKYTEAIVHVTDFTLNNTSYNETPSAYTIQYKVEKVVSIYGVLGNGLPIMSG